MNKGFLLIEALLAIMILSILALTFLGGIRQVLNLEERINQTTEAVLQFEKDLYELETGKRLDLILYGGREPRKIYQFEVKSEEEIETGEKLPHFYQLKTKLSWKDGKHFLEENLFTGEAKI